MSFEEIDLNNLHEKFVQFGKNAKEWQRKCALLLPDIEKFQVWKIKGFRDVYEYAGKLAGMSHWQVDDAIRVLNKIADMPSLLEVAKTKGLYAVRPVATIVTKETENFWAKKSANMTQGELQTYVRDFKSEQRKISSGVSFKQLIKENLNSQELVEASKFKILAMKLKPDVAEKLEKLNKGDWNELMEKFLELYTEDLEKLRPEIEENASRSIPAKIERFIVKRCRGKCEFPGCNQEYKNLHHVDRYALNKCHDPDRIVALCQPHHDLAHKGLIDEELDTALNSKSIMPAQNWKIRRGVDYTSTNWGIDSRVQFYRRGG